MFKFVVLSALLAAAVAEPGLVAAPAYSYGTYLSSPYYAGAALAPTAYSTQVSYTGYPGYAPLTYSAPLGHLIKKRSAPLLAASTYVAPSSYIAPAYPAAAYGSPYYAAAAAAPYYSAGYPYYTAGSPYYSQYLIKK